jgi:hypothetical protein
MRLLTDRLWPLWREFFPGDMEQNFLWWGYAYPTIFLRYGTSEQFGYFFKMCSLFTVH